MDSFVEEKSLSVILFDGKSKRKHAKDFFETS